MRPAKMRLEDAIVYVLASAGRGYSTAEIAYIINQNEIHLRKDGHPRENTALQQQILENNGLILSEQVIGVKANPTRLVARNRLQAALSEAVILAQCPAHSGSLHTMRFARQYRKQCYAATFPKRTEANAGNYNLLDNHLAKPL